MSIAVQCEECFQNYKVKEERAGQTLKCKSCGSKMRVPAVEEEFEDLSADYGEPITPPRKKKPTAAPAKKKKKKKSSAQSLNISAGKLIKKAFGAFSMVIGVLILVLGIYSIFAGPGPNGEKARPVYAALVASGFIGVGKKWMFDD